jgi:WD40 repeat protein
MCNIGLNEEFQDRYFVISEIVDSKKFNASSYYQKESKQEKRDKLYKRTVSEISQAKPGRLVFLLSHGLRRLREERKQVAGEKYNIFEDEFIPFADIADQPPNRIAKTVKLPAESKPTSQVYSSNGRHLFIGTSDGFVEVWSPMTRTLAADIKYQADEVFIMHDHSITALCPTKDSDFLAVADSSRKINIWKVEKGNILLSLSDTHKGTVGVMAFTEEEDHIITAASDIKVWGLKSGRKVNEMSGHDGSVTVLRIFEGLIMSGG